MTVYIVITLCVNINPIAPIAIEYVFLFSLNKSYIPINTIGKNINDASSAIAILV